MDPIRRLAESGSAVMGTVDPDSGVHLVPVVFTLIGDDRILIDVDHRIVGAGSSCFPTQDT